ncbi:MAG: hypothetical protein HXY50_14355 [Ignavibacteriaceae bacterium]|nr:hypothetical protein [Ignavibacteriaceae bacterium]
MSKSKLFFVSILSLLVFTASFLQAQEKKVFKFKKGDHFSWETKDDLNLSEEQKKQFDDLELQHEKRMIDLRAELEKSKLTKRELIKKGNVNRNDYLAVEEKIIAAENKIRMEKAKFKMDKYSLLDEKQKKSFFNEFEHDFIFNFNMDGLDDKLKILKERVHKIMPCPPNLDEIEKDIQIEIEDDEI